MPDAIVLRNVTRSYSTGVDVVTAAHELNFNAMRGEFVCVLGASGSGKTTLLNLIAGLDRPDNGSIRVNDREITGLSDKELTRFRLAEMGVVFQDHNLIDEFTARENVMLPLEVAGVPWGEASSQAERQLAAVGIEDLGNRFPRQLSGGQRQRVGIARALVGGRHVLLADEPTGALDSANSRALFEVLRVLCEAGTCVVLATHDPLAQQFADAVYAMTDGNLSRAQTRS
ncbi:ABC transporter ATP-binding protein [Nocardioides endophyticus]|uniref:ABC transporter ATP-binding protein n=1 Tax=Nocardioides endophyticus TaxID=1353775 RepID=UPI0031EFED3C